MEDSAEVRAWKLHGFALILQYYRSHILDDDAPRLNKCFAFEPFFGSIDIDIIHTNATKSLHGEGLCLILDVLELGLTLPSPKLEEINFEC